MCRTEHKERLARWKKHHPKELRRAKHSWATFCTCPYSAFVVVPCSPRWLEVVCRWHGKMVMKTFANELATMGLVRLLDGDRDIPLPMERNHRWRDSITHLFAFLHPKSPLYCIVVQFIILQSTFHCFSFSSVFTIWRRDCDKATCGRTPKGNHPMSRQFWVHLVEIKNFLKWSTPPLEYFPLKMCQLPFSE